MLFVSLYLAVADTVLASLGPPGWREPLDCVRASELCNQNSQCSSRYRIMRQCLSGGDKERSAMLASKECQGALEVLQDSPLYDCRCKRGMKKELQCLQNYWSIHMGLTEGEEFYETSPYEPIHFSEEYRHASIISAGKPCNPCLDAAKACNLNETCKRLRSAYNSICSKALRQFFERVPWELSYPLLFCSCPDQACAERRRRTIVPSCSHQERHKPSCLELRHICRSDALCRSRLADFHMNCQMTSHTVTSCPHDNYHGCLMSYVGLIGSDVTPNYSDSSPSNITISLWCTCRGTGSQERECDAFHRDFTHNTCLSESSVCRCVSAGLVRTSCYCRSQKDLMLLPVSEGPHVTAGLVRTSCYCRSHEDLMLLQVSEGPHVTAGLRRTSCYCRSREDLMLLPVS
uniref:GDNF family receptor alpha 2 n=1 Tax=Seriola lalandi dorsalis TaxID=1841481 RepID=A0A3B4Z5T7_SERLL